MPKAEVIVRLVQEIDAIPLSQFERDNREWFEKFVPPRPEGFFDETEMAGILQNAVKSAANGETYLHLILSSSGEILGRINLTRSEQGDQNTAELGYRIAEHAIGKGIASEAVLRVCKLAYENYGLTKIEAISLVNNAASISVLRKTGFEQTGVLKNYTKQNDKDIDAYSFLKTL